MTNESLETIQDEHSEELKVTFNPPLYLQRRIWVLDLLRAEQVTKVLDVGCGEGQLLSVLCQPAPRLPAPPPNVLPRDNSEADSLPLSPVCNDEIPNLYPTHIMGVDICSSDLKFAVQSTTPPRSGLDSEDQNAYCFSNVGLRWGDLDVKIWKGGLEAINEEFVDTECIISTEVIEHLPPEIFPAFAPVLLGVYHPLLFLVTTPSFTFNARFTAPNAPSSARRGYIDPTKRTDRIFRHSDHKFEWTIEEFKKWCDDTALDWGYEVQISSVGQSTEIDQWGRDEELGGATSVAVFRRREMENREQKGREVLRALGLETNIHELLVNHQHSAHPSSQKPLSLEEIALGVKAKMEELREGLMTVESLWFERDVAVSCGGWIEVMIRAIEESAHLILKRDGKALGGKRGNWLVELIGGMTEENWPAEKRESDETSFDWATQEETESSDDGWSGSTDMDGDVSWNESEDGDDTDGPESISWPHGGWESVDEEVTVLRRNGWGGCDWTQNDISDAPHGSGNSTAGWDGDEDESDDTS